MKAAVHEKYGDPNEVIKIKNIKKPTIANNEVLVKVAVTTVNRTDCGFLRGKPLVVRFFSGLDKPNKTVSGSDFAGIVEEVGEDVVLFKKGDRVFGFKDESLESHAEYLKIEENGNLITIPKGVTYKQAVASCEGAHYANNFVKKLKKKKGQKILVNGGTGAIGSAIIQILNYYGADVTATCNTQNIEVIKKLGVEKIIDYTKEDFTKGKVKYDYVLDSVGKSSFNKCKAILKKNGIYMSSELGQYAQNTYLPLYTHIFDDKKVVFPLPTNIKESLLFMKKLLEEKQFKPLIDKEYNLDEIVEAFIYVELGEKVGNVILNI